MMPWEHLLFGYVTYSLLVRVFTQGRPATAGVAGVVCGSLLPDLVDKPLAWQFGFFGSGYGIGHSLFTATAVCSLVLYVGYRRDSNALSTGLSVGYLVHLPGDLATAVLSSEPIPYGRVLWPLVSLGDGYDSDFRGELTENLEDYSRWIGDQLATGTPDGYFAGLLCVAGVALLLWVDDGLPLLRELYAGCREAITLLAK